MPKLKIVGKRGRRVFCHRCKELIERGKEAYATERGSRARPKWWHKECYEKIEYG